MHSSEPGDGHRQPIRLADARRRRWFSKRDGAILGTLVLLFVLARTLGSTEPDWQESYPEPIANLLALVTEEISFEGDRVAGFRAMVSYAARLQPAAEALGAHRGAAVAPLMQLIDIDPETGRRPQEGLNRVRAMHALAAIGSEASEAAPRLLAIVADPSEHELHQLNALETVVAIGNIPASEVPVILRVLRTKTDIDFREAAIDAVAIIGPAAAAAIPDLTAALRDQDPFVRIAAARALGAIGPAARSAIPALVLALYDPIPAMRMRAAESLAKFGHAAEPAVEALIGLLSPDQAMERPVDDISLEGEVGALLEDALDGEGPDIDGLRGTNSDEYRTFVINNVRSTAARTLARIGPAATDAIPALLEAARDRDDSVREAASEALAAIRGG